MTRTTRFGNPALAAVALVAVAEVSAIAAKDPRAKYVVKSVKLTYNATATTTVAPNPGGAAGSLTVTLAATLTGVGVGGAVTLSTPEVRSEYMCSPTCPAFRANGVVTITETFRPADPAAAPVTCRTSKRLAKPAMGKVDFMASATSTRTFKVRILDAPDANALFSVNRDSRCALPSLSPTEGSNYPLFGHVDGFAVGGIGKKTIALELPANALRPSTYPWASQGSTTMKASAVLVRK